MGSVNWLTRFAQVVAGRTPGKWSKIVEHPFGNAHSSGPYHHRDPDGTLVQAGKKAAADAAFIALAGTVADEVLELVRAVSSYSDAQLEVMTFHFREQKIRQQQIADKEFDKMRASLAKLAAKVEVSI